MKSPVSSDARKIRLLMELRRQGIADTATLAALERVPRELFVPQAFQDQAYANKALPIGHGQTVSQPLVVALMTQALSAHAEAKTLEIGTGCGYQTAVLAGLCREVFSIERYSDLLDEAEPRFAQLGLRNIKTRAGDGFEGWPETAPFDRILVTAAAEAIPARLALQLADGGIMVLPLGPHGALQRLVRLTRHGYELAEEDLGPVRFVPLLPGLPGKGE